MTRQRRPYQRIGVCEARALIERGEALVLDARDEASFRAAHVDGAQPISIKNLSAIIASTSTARPIVIYCYHGYASLEYAQVFSDFGFAEVYSVDGGYKAWRETLPPPGREAPDAALQHWLVEQGFPQGGINAIIANDTTPLMRASHRGEIAIVAILIEAGVLLNARNADGNNALWLACVGGHLDVIDALVKAGIEIDNRNDNGATALMYAASAGKAEIVARLLAIGAGTDLETLDGFTPLDLASTVECLALIRHATRLASSTNIDAGTAATSSRDL